MEEAATIPPADLQRLTLHACGRVAHISCQFAAATLIANAYDAMLREGSGAADLEYTVRMADESGGFYLQPHGSPTLFASDDGDLIFCFEKDFTIALQLLRRDLYFVHAAALAIDGDAILLVAPSGYGKSTTTWGLLHHGFSYLSDELAPIDLDSLTVYPYAHALCLKREPPSDYPLPGQTLRTSRTLHVPARFLPAETVADSVPLAGILFVEYCPTALRPEIAPISKSEATARLFTQALNPLAHEEDGLRAATTISSRAKFCYALRSADLRETCELVAALARRNH